MNKPLISCLCPTKNNPEMVKVAIDCFNNQTYPNKELILVADEKNPYMEDLEKFTKENIKLFHAPYRTPIADLRNISVKHASGKYIATWDDDDIHHSKRLTSQYETIVKSGKEVCYLTNSIIKDTIENVIGLSKYSTCMDCTMLALRDNFPKYSNPLPQNSCGDVFIRKHYSSKNQVVFLEKPHLYIYNIHETNTCNYFHQKNWIDIVI